MGLLNHPASVGEKTQQGISSPRGSWNVLRVNSNGLGVLVDEELNFSWQSALAAKKPILSCAASKGPSHLGLWFCTSTLFSWDPTWTTASSSRVFYIWKTWPCRSELRGDMRIFTAGLENLSWQDRVGQLGLFNLEKNRLQGDLKEPSSA